MNFANHNLLIIVNLLIVNPNVMFFPAFITIESFYRQPIEESFKQEAAAYPVSEFYFTLWTKRHFFCCFSSN